MRGKLRVGGDESSETGSLHGFFSGNHLEDGFLHFGIVKSMISFAY